MLRGVFFDLDDTLITSSDALQYAMGVTAQLAQSIFPHLTGQHLLQAMTESYQNHFAFGRPGYQCLSTISTSDLRRQLTTLTLEKLLLSYDANTVDTLQRCYTQAECHTLKVFPGVEYTLKSLKPHFVLGIITNGPSQLQREKLKLLNLDHWFDVIIIDSEYGRPKPDRGLFGHAASQAHLESNELMFVGNSLDADIYGAKSAGWYSTYLSSENSDEAHYTIAHLKELLHIPLVEENLSLATRTNLADTI